MTDYAELIARFDGLILTPEKEDLLAALKAVIAERDNLSDKLALSEALAIGAYRKAKAEAAALRARVAEVEGEVDVAFNLGVQWMQDFLCANAAAYDFGPNRICEAAELALRAKAKEAGGPVR